MNIKSIITAAIALLISTDSLQRWRKTGESYEQGW